MNLFCKESESKDFFFLFFFFGGGGCRVGGVDGGWGELSK